MINSIDTQATQTAAKLATICGVSRFDFKIVTKAGEPHLAVTIGAENETYYQSLKELNSSLADDNTFKDRIFFRVRPPKVWLRSIEVELLLRTLSESLVVGKSLIGTDLSKRLIPFGQDTRITTKTNHLVFGRRGAGKSSLLLWLCTELDKQNTPYVWLSMQPYQGRSDLLAVWQILTELVVELAKRNSPTSELTQVRSELAKRESTGKQPERNEIRMMMPKIVQAILSLGNANNGLFILVDDLYLLSSQIQLTLLSSLLAISRGQNIFFKVSSVENFTTLYDPNSREGIQTSGDAQVIKLDFNLVNPRTAHEHIRDIVDKYLQFAGIPSSGVLFSLGVIERLTWVSAGVPRDALYIVGKAIEKAQSAERSHVAVTDINMAAADYLTEKESLARGESGSESDELMETMADIKKFCLEERKWNAFLVHILSGNETYKKIKKISDLRFIHLIHQGFTPSKLGERYEAYMLDYAYYTGFRKSRGVREFIDELRLPKVEELRGIPKYEYEERA